MSDLSNELASEYGGFNDLPSFRAESGLTQADISDVDALRVINEDMQEQVRIANVEKSKEQQERNKLSSELSNVRSAKANTDRELENEKARRGLYDPLGPFRSPSTMADYYAKERLKQEVRDDLARDHRIKQYELEEERKRMKANAKLWAEPKVRVSKPKTKSKVKSKSRSRSKSKSRSRSKSKSRSSGKPKSGTKSKK
jgi:hypothetical protein